MNAKLPSLVVRGPDGKNFTVDLDKDSLAIGRFPEFNDISLEPDPQWLVTRKVHCVVERSEGGWWIVDNGSVNGTFLRHGHSVDAVEGRMPLSGGDVILVLGRLTDDGKPVYWELEFSDPEKTVAVEGIPRTAYLEYEPLSARLYRVTGAKREEIDKLNPQEHKLIRHMDHRNRSNNNVPVLCSHEEIITAVWGDEEKDFHAQDEVAHLVWRIRQKVEVDAREPRFLQMERGLGYRLITRPAGR